MRYTFTAAIALCAATGGTALAGQASFTLLPVSGATDLTIDEFGRTLVLTNDGGYGGAVYIWEDGFLNFLGNGIPWGISEDGNTVSGSGFNLEDDQEAARWTLANGWDLLGYLPNALTCPSRSSGYRCSADGDTVVGLSWDGCSGRAFKWTPTGGMVQLETLGNGGNRASNVSADGEVIVGFAQGNFNRTPAVWLASTGLAHPAFPFDMDALGEMWAVTPDHGTIVGQYDNAATYWTEAEGFVSIGFLDQDGTAQAYDVSDDGKTIVGGSGSVFTGKEAFVWTETRGMEKLSERLTGLGVDMSGVSYLGWATAVSRDGSTIVGWALVPPEQPGELAQQRAYVATLPEPEPLPCLADFNGDQTVGFADLTQLLNAWGPCAGCDEDIDNGGLVGFADLTLMLNAWGPCP